METPAATADAPEGLDAALDACDGIEGPLLPILHRVQSARWRRSRSSRVRTG
jgi:hypothetical protein